MPGTRPLKGNRIVILHQKTQGLKGNLGRTYYIFPNIFLESIVQQSFEMEEIEGECLSHSLNISKNQWYSNLGLLFIDSA